MNIPAQLARCFATSLVNDTYGLKNDPDLRSETMTYKQAQRHAYSRQWLGTEEKEHRSHSANNTRTIDPLPSGKKALPTKWVYKYKFDDYGKPVWFKARFVFLRQPKKIRTLESDIRPCGSRDYSQILLALVAALDVECDQLDVVIVSLNGVLDVAVLSDWEWGSASAK